MKSKLSHTWLRIWTVPLPRPPGNEMYFAGGVVAAGGVVLLILGRRHESDQVAWAVYPGGVGHGGMF